MLILVTSLNIVPSAETSEETQPRYSINAVTFRKNGTFLNNDDSVHHRMFLILPIFQMVAAGNFYVVTNPDVFIDNSLTDKTHLSDPHQWPVFRYRVKIFLCGNMIVPHQAG